MLSKGSLLSLGRVSIVVRLWIAAALMAPHAVNGIQDPTKEAMQQASRILSAVAIEGLCHPNTNRYAPTFPKCTTEANPERRLEDYYAASDDNDDNSEIEEEITEEDLRKTSYLFNGLMALFCVIGGAMMAGLTVGLLSLDPLLLVIKMKAGETEKERRQAANLLPIVKRHHQLMVSLLLLNTMCGEALPVFLQALVPDSVAILVSVLLVLIFGEILPTAIFTGKHQLLIASRLAPLVKLIMMVMWPLTYPIARLLDSILHDDDGDHHGGDGHGDNTGEENEHVPTTIYSRCELAALVRIQYDQRLLAKQRRKQERVSSLASLPQLDSADPQIPDFQLSSDVRALKTNLLHHSTPHTHHSRSDSIDGDEIMMIEGALQMKTKTAIDVYLSYHKVFCVPDDMPLDDKNIFTIYASGYSRVPVFERGDRRLVKGILMTRQLMVVKRQQQEQEQQTQTYETVSDLNLHVPQCVAPHTNLVALVNLFQTGGSAVRAGHMALVCARPHIANEALEKGQGVPLEAGLMGILTLEDVLEALLQEDILDEMDAAGRKPLVEDLERMDDEAGLMPVLHEMDSMDESSSYHLA